MTVAAALFLLWVVTHARKGSAVVNPARQVTGRSGRTYSVTAAAAAPNFVTSSVFISADVAAPGASHDVMLIQYRQYTAATGPTAESGQSFQPGDRELVFRAPMAPINAVDDPVADAVNDFGPFAADNGLT